MWLFKRNCFCCYLLESLTPFQVCQPWTTAVNICLMVLSRLLVLIPHRADLDQNPAVAPKGCNNKTDPFPYRRGSHVSQPAVPFVIPHPKTSHQHKDFTTTLMFCVALNRVAIAKHTSYYQQKIHTHYFDANSEHVRDLPQRACGGVTQVSHPPSCSPLSRTRERTRQKSLWAEVRQGDGLLITATGRKGSICRK